MGKNSNLEPSPWALVGNSGDSPGLENVVKRWGCLGRFVFLFTLMQAHEKQTGEPVKNLNQNASP